MENKIQKYFKEKIERNKLVIQILKDEIEELEEMIEELKNAK